MRHEPQETYRLVKGDGDYLEFGVNDFFLTTLSNFGNPDVKYASEETYFMDGVRVSNYNLSPRTMSLELLAYDPNMKNRADFWRMREKLLSFLSAELGDLKLQVFKQDNRNFELRKVRPTPGLTMTGNTDNSSRNDWKVFESLVITAFDPAWYLIEEKQELGLYTQVADDLKFPAVFPIVFSLEGVLITLPNNFSYEGTWKSYPKVVVNGPYDQLILQNKWNDATIRLTAPITFGEKRIIDLSDPIEGFTIKDGTGQNKVSDLDVESDLVNFYFKPSEKNNMTASLINGSEANSYIDFYIFERYKGI